MRAIYMGSPEFAVPSLEATAECCDLVAVYTQPDRPRGRRGSQLVPTPVKARALELGVPVHEPARIRDEEVVEQLRAYAPDVILVAAYAKLIPPVILELPRHGCINVHPSLLPRYRGAIPVQAAVMNGDSETGVCTFFMDEGYDTGDLILTIKTPLGQDETGEELMARLAGMGADLLKETVAALAAGTAPRVPQPAEAEGGYTKPLKKHDLMVDWSQPAERVRNFIRALAHEPGAAVRLGEQPIKVGKARVHSAEGRPGEVIDVLKGEGPVVACGQGSVVLLEVKPPGKKWMDAWSYQQGAKLVPGVRFELATV
ncbi:MAG: methionyl-tRNA formyltransferase [Vulcanimicrobiota bacterium]